MGSTVVRGEVSAVVTYTGAHTFFGKTAMLIQAASDSESNMQVRRRVARVGEAPDPRVSSPRTAVSADSPVDTRQTPIYAGGAFLYYDHALRYLDGSLLHWYVASFQRARQRKRDACTQSRHPINHVWLTNHRPYFLCPAISVSVPVLRARRRFQGITQLHCRSPHCFHSHGHGGMPTLETRPLGVPVQPT